MSASKILKNNTVSAINLDIGITVPASGQYTLNATEFLDAAESDDLVTEIGASNITVNDGTNDLSISDGMDLIKGVFQKHRIIGDTDNTLIGNVGDALKVTGGDNGVSNNPVPGQDVIYKNVALFNSGSKNMNVNGSTVNVNFDFTPGASEVWYIESISFLILDSGAMDFDDFGTVTGLSNGVQILIRSKGTEYEYTNIKNNADISLVFDGAGGVEAGEGTVGWLDEDDYFFGRLILNVPIKLDNSTSDYIRFKIRDNLTSLTTVQASVRLWRVI